MRRLVGLVGLAIVALAVTSVNAGEVEDRWGIGAEYGVWKLVGGSRDYSNVDSEFALSGRRGLSPHWSAELALRYGRIRPGSDAPAQAADWPDLVTEIYNPTLSFEYQFVPSRSFSPYVGVGFGLANWRVMAAKSTSFFWPDGTTVQGFDKDGNGYQTLTRTDVTLLAELGFEWFPSSAVSFRLGGRYQALPFNKLDNIGVGSWDWTKNPARVDANTGLVQGYLAVTVWFGSSDSDKDGYKNNDDGCPDRAEDYDGFEDTDGCPDLDNDRDGIPDDRDQCPDDPEDRDGYQDEDGCPDPDNDGDGVMDSQDQCPDEAEDIDGYQDQDGCPDPDNDQDGVPDAQDACPDTPPGTEVGPDGCPLPAPEPSLVPALVGAGLLLEGVNFRTGSAELTPESISVLAGVAESLKANPDARVEIRGHTDSTGSAEVNRDVSQRRAMAVRDVLVQMGIESGRLTAVGYGEDYPIADNGTAAGRRENRRVELHRVD